MAMSSFWMAGSIYKQEKNIKMEAGIMKTMK